MSKKRTKRRPKPIPAICAVVAQRRQDIPVVIANHRAWSRGIVPWTRPIDALWKVNTAEILEYADRHEALIIPISKLDRRVKFIAVFIDDMEPLK